MFSAPSGWTSAANGGSPRGDDRRRRARAVGDRLGVVCTSSRDKTPTRRATGPGSSGRSGRSSSSSSSASSSTLSSTTLRETVVVAVSGRPSRIAKESASASANGVSSVSGPASRGRNPIIPDGVCLKRSRAPSPPRPRPRLAAHSPAPARCASLEAAADNEGNESESMESIRFRGGSRSFERSSPFESPSPFESSAAFFFARVRRRRFLPVVVAESFSSSFGLSFPRYFRGAFRSSPAYLSSRSRNDAGTRASAWKTSAGAAAPSAVPSAPQRASAGTSERLAQPHARRRDARRVFRVGERVQAHVRHRAGGARARGAREHAGDAAELRRRRGATKP